MYSEWSKSRDAEGFEGTPSFTIAPSPHHTTRAERLTPVFAQYVSVNLHKNNEYVINRGSGELKEGGEGGIKEREIP